MNKLILIFAIFAGTFATNAITAKEAYRLGRDRVSDKVQDQVLSFYGKGSPKDIDTWYIKFFDPETQEKASVVVIEKGRFDRSYPAKVDNPNDEALAFEPDFGGVDTPRILKVAADYAEEIKLPYDGTRVYLNKAKPDRKPVWTVEFLAKDRPLGYVYVDARSGEFTGYRPPPAIKRETLTEKNSEKPLAERIREAALEIGGDLEEFFTGERTVDKE